MTAAHPSLHAAMVRELDRIADLHECDPPDAIVAVPGFDFADPNSAGVSIYTCPTCRPMVVEVIRRAYGDTVTRPLPIRPTVHPLAYQGRLPL
jgi:hypothetical protein